VSEQARQIIRRHAPTAAVNARYAAVASVVNVHGARYLVDGDGRGKWDARLVRPARPMATRRRSFRAWLSRLEAAMRDILTHGTMGEW